MLGSCISCGLRFTVLRPKNLPDAVNTALVMSLTFQVLHHIGSGSGNELGGRPGWTCGDGQNGDHQGHGTMSWEVRCGFQLFGPDGLPRAWAHFQR